MCSRSRNRRAREQTNLRPLRSRCLCGSGPKEINFCSAIATAPAEAYMCSITDSTPEASVAERRVRAPALRLESAVWHRTIPMDY